MAGLGTDQTYGSCNYSCSLNYTLVNVPADSDIAGPGVLFSFIITTILSNLLMCSAFMLYFRHNHMSNSIDRFLTPRRSITPEVYTFWSSVFIPIVKSLADTQLVTGWALLLIGFAKCDVTMYHFNIISRLAMLASLTYLNALVILKEHLIGSHGGRSWRVACILSIGGLSIAANYIQYGASGNHAPATPIRCVLKEPVVQSKVTLVLVMSGWTYLYGLVVLHLYPSVEDWLKRTIRSPLESFFSRFLHLERLRSGLSEVPTFKMYCLYVWEAYQTLRKSLMMYIFASWAIVAVLCARLFHDRAYGKRIMTADDWSAQGQWGFGQVLPMLLLLLCLVFALETYYEVSSKWRHPHESEILGSPDINPLADTLPSNEPSNAKSTHISTYRLDSVRSLASQD